MRAKAYGLSVLMKAFVEGFGFSVLLSDGVQGSGSALQGFYEFLSCYKVQEPGLRKLR